MEILLAGLLGGIGFLISNNEKPVKQTKYKKFDTKISKNEIPSSKNIYHSRNSEKVFNNELEQATKAYQKAFHDDILYRDYPELSWEDRHYAKSDRFVQLEKDIQNPYLNSSTRIPTSTLNEFRKTDAIKSYDLQKATNTLTETLNSRRNNIPNSTYTEIGRTSQNTPIYKTNYPNEKSTLVYENGHNNMEKFVGGGVNQNTRIDANRTILETYTGTNPVYAHKKEVKRFFPLVRDPYAVGGLPSSSNREMDRYIPSITRQNILPFNQIRVAPGLNRDHMEHSTNVGFHDPFRPMGRGLLKDINERRVNPKLTYKGRVSGEVFWIPYGTKTAPVITRKDVDLSFTNFKPGEVLPEVRGNPKLPEGEKIKEGFTNNFDTFQPPIVYREMRHTGAEVDKGVVLDQNTIVLKETERDDTGPRLAALPGHNIAETLRNQTYNFDIAKETIREQTEDNVHDKINPNDENRRNQTYYFDKAKETVREQTEDNVHDKINPQDENRRNQTYYFDKARETIREQTEDHIHDKINPNDENRRNQTYYFDKAKETIREQTEDHIHNKINPGAVSRFRLHDITAFLNASINALKEAAIAKNRAPTTEGVKLIPDKSIIGKWDVFRRQQFDTYDYTKSFNPSVEASINASKEMIGELTQLYPEYEKQIRIQAQRTDPVINQKFREENPYTQSIHSWQVPYNPKYPNSEIVSERIKYM